MTTISGTFTATDQRTGPFFLRPTEVARVTLTFTGTATISLDEIVGDSVYKTFKTFTATETYDYRNETPSAKRLQLRAQAVSGGSSVAYSIADVVGDQVLEEWRAADGTLVGQMTDEGFVGQVFTPAAQGGVVHLFDYLTPAEIADAVGLTRTLDHTTNVQAFLTAITAGKQGVVPFGYYNVNNLTLAGARTRLLFEGYAIFWKNANGPALTISGDDVHCENVETRDDSATYTGHGIVVTGARPKFFHCSSQGHELRALHLTDAGALEVIGQRSLWSTRDTGGTGYDIEVVRGLYALIDGVVTSKASGGFKFTDCGSQKVVDCQFGKYTIAADTSPAGVNAGTVMGSRVLGAITIDVSNSIVTNNALGTSATVTWGVGTSGHQFIGNIESGAAVVNNGSANGCVIIRHIEGTTDGDLVIRFGDDNSAALMRMDDGVVGTFTFPSVEIPNNVNYRGMRASPNGTSTAFTLGASASDNVSFAAQVGSHQRSVVTGQVFQDIINSIVKAHTSASGHTLGDGTTAASVGGVNSLTRNVKGTTAIAQGVATTVATITIPNAAHSCKIRFTVVAALGAGGAIGADEASATNTYDVVVARTAGVNAVLGISTAYGVIANPVAGGATITAPLTLAAVSGAVGASNTCAVQVTITAGSGSSTNHTALVSWEILNARATGVTVA